jgi:hypothetical protein
MRISTAFVTVAAVLAAAMPAVAQNKNPMVGGAPMLANKNIIENAVNSKDHTTLVAAVKAAGLVIPSPARALSPFLHLPMLPSRSCRLEPWTTL